MFDWLDKHRKAYTNYREISILICFLLYESQWAALAGLCEKSYTGMLVYGKDGRGITLILQLVYSLKKRYCKCKYLPRLLSFKIYHKTVHEQLKLDIYSSSNTLFC